VVFTPSGKRARCRDGTTILDAARSLGVDLDSICGGRGICGRCQVDVAAGQFPKHGITSEAGNLSGWDKTEGTYIGPRGELKPGRRLGCQAHVHGDVVIDVPPESQVHRQVVRKAADGRAITIDPVVTLHYVEVAAPDMHDPASDFRRLAAALRAEWRIEDLRAGQPVLTTLQKALRMGAWKVTAAVRGRDPAAVCPRPFLRASGVSFT